MLQTCEMNDSVVKDAFQCPQLPKKINFSKIYFCFSSRLLLLYVTPFCFWITEAEKVVGWAKSHYLSSCLLPSVKGDRLQVPRER